MHKIPREMEERSSRASPQPKPGSWHHVAQPPDLIGGLLGGLFLEQSLEGLGGERGEEERRLHCRTTDDRKRF